MKCKQIEAYSFSVPHSSGIDAGITKILSENPESEFFDMFQYTGVYTKKSDSNKNEIGTVYVITILLKK